MISRLKFSGNWLIQDQIIRIDRENDLQLKISDETMRADQLADDNKALLERLDLLEIERDQAVAKAAEMEIDNLNFMKYSLEYWNIGILEYLNT